MAVSVVAHIGFVGNFGGGSGSTTSSAIDTTGATFLVAAHSHFGGSTFSDSKSNTWTLISAGNNGGLALDFYVAINPVVGSGHTFTITNGFPSAYVIAMSGLYTVRDLATGVPANSGSSVTSVATAAFTPKYDNSLILTAVALSTGLTGISVNGAFAISDSSGGVSGQAQGGGIAWQQQGAASSVTPTWSWTGSSEAVIGCVVFATTPSGSGGGETSAVFA